MRLVVIGLGIQGRRRVAMAADDVVATVDPIVPEARHRDIRHVPLASFDAACVCTPDQVKVELVRYLLSHGKHVLVEKPLLADDADDLEGLAALARSAGVACYTAYNHRFEPHVVRLKDVLASGVLGRVFCARLFYGNGTARDVQASPWRDQGLGVLSDLGSHLLDMASLLFGQPEGRLEAWGLHCFENRAFDHALFGTAAQSPALQCEASLVCWRNTFTVDVLGEFGSAHVDGLCKWGRSTLTVRARVLPSGRPAEHVQTVEGPDPTWQAEYRHFKERCRTGGTTIDHDMWINRVLTTLAHAWAETTLRR